MIWPQSCAHATHS
uniref:Uncharacterized protein n=1 Tax=Anguilla anguilla TaxID=7936 RepID=A0A0E9U9R2_ANGAN